MATADSGSADSVSTSWAAKAPTLFTLCLGLGLVIALATILLRNRPAEMPTVMVDARDTVSYTHRATREEALALGQALKEVGFLTGRGASVILSKRGDTVVSLVVTEGSWDLPDVVSRFGEMGRRIAPAVGGFPFRIRLLDQNLAMRRELVVGKESLGMRDTIFYYGSATAEEAAALGQSLRSAGAMQDVGATVVLAKGDVTTVSFIVQHSPWDRPEVVTAFENIVRRVAPTVGGLPVRLRFLDPGGVMHKEVSVL